MTDVQPKELAEVFDAKTVFHRTVDETPFVDMVNDPRFRRSKPSTAMIKWLGGDDMETGPWAFWVDHPAGRRAVPHKHTAARIEYLLEGELRFFKGEEALKWHRGEEAEYTVYSPGTLSYVPAGQLYGYEVTKPSKLASAPMSSAFGNSSSSPLTSASGVSPKRMAQTPRLVAATRIGPIEVSPTAKRMVSPAPPAR